MPHKSPPSPGNTRLAPAILLQKRHKKHKKGIDQNHIIVGFGCQHVSEQKPQEQDSAHIPLLCPFPDQPVQHTRLTGQLIQHKADAKAQAKQPFHMFSRKQGKQLACVKIIGCLFRQSRSAVSANGRRHAVVPDIRRQIVPRFRVIPDGIPAFPLFPIGRLKPAEGNRSHRFWR